MEVSFGTSIYLLYICSMRAQDQKVQAIARQTGMLFMSNGREYAKTVTVDNFLMEFEYETPDTVAYIEVYDTNSK